MFTFVNRYVPTDTYTEIIRKKNFFIQITVSSVEFIDHNGAYDNLIFHTTDIIELKTDNFLKQENIGNYLLSHPKFLSPKFLPTSMLNNGTIYTKQ